MIRRKKEVKRIFFTVLFVIAIFLSNVLILNNINVFQDENTNNEVVLDELPLNTASELDYKKTGSFGQVFKNLLHTLTILLESGSSPFGEV